MRLTSSSSASKCLPYIFCCSSGLLPAICKADDIRKQQKIVCHYFAIIKFAEIHFWSKVIFIVLSHTLMATCWPFFAESTGLKLFSMEAIRPMSIKSFEGTQIGAPIWNTNPKSVLEPDKWLRTTIGKQKPTWHSTALDLLKLNKLIPTTENHGFQNVTYEKIRCISSN